MAKNKQRRERKERKNGSDSVCLINKFKTGQANFDIENH